MQADVPLGVDRAEVAGAAPAVGVGHERVGGADGDLSDAVCVGPLHDQLEPTDRTAHGGEQLRPASEGPQVVGVGQGGDRAHLGLTEDLHELGVGQRGERRPQRVDVDRRRAVLQRGGRGVGEGTFGEEEVDHRRDEQGTGHAQLPHTSPPVDREPALGDERGARPERAQHHRDAARVVQRRCRAVTGAGAEAEELAVDGDPGQQRLVPDRHRLGRAGGAGGVDDGDEVAGFSRSAREGATRRHAVDHLHIDAGVGGRFGTEGDRRRLGQQRSGTEVLHGDADLLGGEASAERASGRPESAAPTVRAMAAADSSTRAGTGAPTGKPSPSSHVLAPPARASSSSPLQVTSSSTTTGADEPDHRATTSSFHVPACTRFATVLDTSVEFGSCT